MQKSLVLSTISFVTATAITAQSTLVSTSSMLSGSTNMNSASSIMLSSVSSVGYKGADERSKLKMFRVAILPFDTKGAKIDGDIDQEQL